MQAWGLQANTSCQTNIILISCTFHKPRSRVKAPLRYFLNPWNAWRTKISLSRRKQSFSFTLQSLKLQQQRATLNHNKQHSAPNYQSCTPADSIYYPICSHRCRKSGKHGTTCCPTTVAKVRYSRHLFFFPAYDSPLNQKAVSLPLSRKTPERERMMILPFIKARLTRGRALSKEDSSNDLEAKLFARACI